MRYSILFSLIFSFFIFTVSSSLFAELPPSAYEAMQAKAPEKLEIEVLQVDVASNPDQSTQTVEILARVITVHKSATELKKDDMIRMTYTVEKREKGWVGPGEVPILSENERTIAYLERKQEADPYTPAAGRMSFMNF